MKGLVLFLRGLLRFIPFAVSLAMPIVSSSWPASAGDENCLAWDREWFGEAADTRPAIDRLAADEPYGQLLEAWKADHCMRLNQVQVIGTHNSYHVQPAPQLLDVLRQFNPALALSLEYTHRPVTEQVGTLQVRQLEFDVFADPNGGLFATPVGGLPQFGGDEPLPLAGMSAPGLKVLHVQDIDYRTRCRTFVSCLEQVKAWSDANPGHLPVMILVEAKDDPIQLPLSFPSAATPVPFTTTHLNEIDAEVRSVFGPDDLMTPDDARGSRPTLEEAILKDGWPTLNELRGRVFFAMDNTDQKRADYMAGHPSLAGRVMFVSAQPGTPEAAFVKINDPVGGFATIRDLVARGYIVRTMADADTVEARGDLTARRDAALASGAQFISTDYPEPDPDFSTYAVDVPGPGACNPVLAPPGCDSSALEQAAQ